MRIAQLGSFWYRRGGLEAVMLADADGLSGRGHDVAPFVSAHALNLPSPYESHFPRNVDHGQLGRDLGLLDRGQEALRLLHNSQAAAAFERFADAFTPDIVHQHGVSRQLSPSVLERAHRRGIPTVLTLHDYSLRCPSAIMSRPGEPVCVERSCAGHRYDRAVRFKCVHGDRLASAVGAVELLVNRALRRYERSVDLFLVPSQYCADRALETGVPRDRLRVMPNAVEPSASAAEPVGDYFLAFGRLVEYKGFDLVVEAAKALPDCSFKIAGDGPDRSRLETLAAGLGNLELSGHLAGNDLLRVLRGSKAVIVPSVWPEPFGMVVLEAWRESRPVIVTDRGALPEFVEGGSGGWAIDVGDLVGLARLLRRLVDEAGLAETVGEEGRRLVERRYDMTTHLDRLEAMYAELVDA